MVLDLPTVTMTTWLKYVAILLSVVKSADTCDNCTKYCSSINTKVALLEGRVASQLTLLYLLTWDPTPYINREGNLFIKSLLCVS